MNVTEKHRGSAKYARAATVDADLVPGVTVVEEMHAAIAEMDRDAAYHARPVQAAMRAIARAAGAAATPGQLALYVAITDFGRSLDTIATAILALQATAVEAVLGDAPPGAVADAWAALSAAYADMATRDGELAAQREAANMEDVWVDVDDDDDDDNDNDDDDNDNDNDDNDNDNDNDNART